MFLSTLSFVQWSVLSWVKGAQHGMHVLRSPADRCAMAVANGVSRVFKVSPSKVTLREFLDALPKMESHYCRRNSAKLYIEPIWRSTAKLYCEYKSHCQLTNIVACSMTVFSNEFTARNLSLFAPKKEQCDTCYGREVRQADDDEYKTHCLAKEQAQNEKT